MPAEAGIEELRNLIAELSSVRRRRYAAFSDDRQHCWRSSRILQSRSVRSPMRGRMFMLSAVGGVISLGSVVRYRGGCHGGSLVFARGSPP